MTQARRFTALAITLLIAGCSQSRVADCRKAVEQHLKSPGSASWGRFEADQGALEVDIRGQVDSDNDMGVSKRTYFVCRFKEGEPVRVAFADTPFDDLETRLREGRPIIDWR